MTYNHPGIARRYTRMLEALDLAIDWMANPPTLKKSSGSKQWECTPDPGSVLSEAASHVGCSETEMDSLIQTILGDGPLNPEQKLTRMLHARKEWAAL